MKKFIAISGKMGRHEFDFELKCNLVEWVGEYEHGYCVHFASKWKETSSAVYFKWWY